MRESVEVDHCIIGGGVVGLFTALFLREKFPESTICLLERNIFLGESSSSRNSGVLHSGIYYPKGSLKHLLCLEGLKFWKTSALFSDTSVKTTGKYIFATDKNEEESMHELFEKGLGNNVDGLRIASRKELNEISSFVNCSAALFSPSSGLVNVPEALKVLERVLLSRDVIIMKSHDLLDIKRKKSSYIVECADYDIDSKHLFNCAGLGSVRVREKLGLNDLSDYYVKGCYLGTSQKISHPCLLYPIPPKNLKGLGVHSTINWDGSIKFGPNTREIEEVSYSLENEDLEEMKSNVVGMFKGVARDRLYGDYSGIRAKILENGQLHTDFWIKSGLGQGLPNYFESCGIESPGLTASPAIAKKLVSLLD